MDFAAGEKRSWLRAQGLKIFPIVGWAERGGYLATGHGNSVPRFHVTWGTGPGVIEPFVRRVREAEQRGVRVVSVSAIASRRSRKPAARSTACAATFSSRATSQRGTASSRRLAGSFALRAQAIIVTSGGIGANHELVRRHWPKRLGEPPRHMISGVPEHVDGLMLDVVKAGGGNIINSDRMWHYPEGIQNYAPIWSRHGIRILSGPSPLWLDARGKRLPVPLFPGFDSLGALAHITRDGHDHSWFVLNERIIGREFALSGSEQNPDLTERSIKLVLGRIGKGAPDPVQALHGARRRLRDPQDVAASSSPA